MPGTDPERITASPDGRPLDEQPKWRQDFPVDWGQDEYVSRRDLAKFMALTSMALVAGQFWIVGQRWLDRPVPFPRRAVATVDQLPPGSSLVFSYPGEEDQRILIRLDEERFVAYDQKCTHLLCPVFPRIEEGVLHCPCHNGYFDIEDGRPIAGPPQRPLPLVQLEIVDGVIYATGIVLRTA